jgi:hypothetical protein
VTVDEAIEAGHGWPVFPTRPNWPDCPTQVKCRVCKSPLTKNGFEDATTDPDVIRGWWARWPDANVAVATGAPGPDVLDVDVKELGSGFAALNILKRAGILKGAQALMRTPSGGIHVYFAGSAQTCHSIPRLYLDFKATGGYVLVPPSMVHGKPYELVERRPGSAGLDWDAVKQLLDPPRPRRTFRTGTWAGGDLPALVRWALAAPVNGDRSAALHRLVGACVRAGMDEQAIHELAATYEPAVDKYGARLPVEVDRSLRRIGAA